MCNCTSSCHGKYHGQVKNCYSSAEEARRVARDCYSKRGVMLYEYPCPEGTGYWHLTQNTERF
jgi:hypothetical protein